MIPWPVTWPHSRPYVKTRLWADREKTEYLHVYVFRDREAMYRFWRHRCRGGGHEAEDFLAWCGTWTMLHVGRSPRPKARSFGEALFFVEGFGVGVVAHEMVHAALGYVVPDPAVKGEGKWPKRTTVHEFVHSERNERLALVTGELVRQFWVWWGPKELAMRRKRRSRR